MSDNQEHSYSSRDSVIKSTKLGFTIFNEMMKTLKCAPR